MDLVMVPRGRHAAAAGRISARRLFVCVALLATAMTAAASDDAQVAVTEQAGTYRVSAAFAVTASADDVIAVLTDFERIPKYMPDMEISRVVERTPVSLLVEQQAVSKFMMFSRRVHLLLDVRTSAGAISFRDRCGKSFAAYEGSWLLSQRDGVTAIDYHLSAKPSFDVPGFVLKRLLKRDAGLLIDRIKAEITARANRRQ